MREALRVRLGRLLIAVLLCSALLLQTPPARASDTYDPAIPANLTTEHLSAEAAILIEESTGNVIFEKNADVVMYPASTTKIMTVMLGIMLGDMDEVVTTTASALAVPEDSSTIPLAEGEQVVFRDLLFATMVKSGNEGANLIAETISGDIGAFVGLMNEAAASMGCTSTHFANPHGYHDPNHYSTARDMAIIAREAMQYPLFREIAATTTFIMPKDNVYRQRTLVSQTQEFLTQTENNASRYYQYATGIKTGNHSEAGRCFVGSASKEGVSLISVVLKTGASSSLRWSDTKKLMEYGFSQYVSVTPETLYQMNPKIVDIASYALDDPDLGRLTLNLKKNDPAANDVIVTTQDRVNYLALNFNSLVSIEYTRDFVAPITAGETMGTLLYAPQTGGEIVEYTLTAARSVARRESLAPSLADIIAYTDADPNPFPRFSLELLLILLLPVLVTVGLIFLVRRLLKREHKKRARTIRPTKRYYR